MNFSHKKSYVEATKNALQNQSTPPTSAPNTDPIAFQLASFLDDFKSIINPLISLLTTVIDKLILSNNDK